MTPEPEPPPPHSPSPLDPGPLKAKMSRLSPADRALVDHHLRAMPDTVLDGTWIFASPLTVEEAVARLVGPGERPGTRAEERALGAQWSALRVVQVGDGVIAHEDTGYGDPPSRLLAALSADGVVSAVAASNTDAMVRFGYARDGQVAFDSPEYAFEEDLTNIPPEMRPLAALAWEDLDRPAVETADWLGVALAMCEKATGLRGDPRGHDADRWYRVPVPWSVQ